MQAPFYIQVNTIFIIQGDKRVSVNLMITAQKTQKYFKQFQSLTMITLLELGITDGVSVSLVSIKVWRLAGEILNITCNSMYCNHQVQGDFLITLYNTMWYKNL
jgi:hypothetical protein